jgi:hypothetical protein
MAPKRTPRLFDIAWTGLVPMSNETKSFLGSCQRRKRIESFFYDCCAVMNAIEDVFSIVSLRLAKAAVNTFRNTYHF